MKRYLLLPLVAIVLASTTFAQSSIQTLDASLTGKIVEKSSKVPMELANVTLFNAADSSQVTGTVTDKYGIFQFSKLLSGAYYLQVGFIGFETLKTRPFILEDAKVDLGALEIEAKHYHNQSGETAAFLDPDEMLEFIRRFGPLVEKEG